MTVCKGLAFTADASHDARGLPGTGIRSKAEAGRIGKVFNTCLAREHSKWVLKHDKGLMERYLSAKKAKAA